MADERKFPTDEIGDQVRAKQDIPVSTVGGDQIVPERAWGKLVELTGRIGQCLVDFGSHGTWWVWREHVYNVTRLETPAARIPSRFHPEATAAEPPADVEGRTFSEADSPIEAQDAPDTEPITASDELVCKRCGSQMRLHHVNDYIPQSAMYNGAVVYRCPSCKMFLEIQDGNDPLTKLERDLADARRQLAEAQAELAEALEARNLFRTESDELNEQLTAAQAARRQLRDTLYMVVRDVTKLIERGYHDTTAGYPITALEGIQETAVRGLDIDSMTAAALTASTSAAPEEE